MDGFLKDIDRNEVLRYLGYKGSIIDENTNLQIDKATELIKKIAMPKIIYRVSDIIFENGLSLSATNFKPLGNDIAALLKDCKKAVLFAATIGNLFETELRKAQITDMAFAVILDSCANSAIENVCDNFQNHIRLSWEKEGMFLTERFSPGYGDMPITQQKEFCMVLDTARKIGVTVSSSGLLVPTKSVTAIIGISENPQPKRIKSCENCTAFANCKFRKDGITCD